eukprot:9579400-Prorocentrum_lima.AAC.1
MLKRIPSMINSNLLFNAGPQEAPHTLWGILMHAFNAASKAETTLDNWQRFINWLQLNNGR